MGLYQRRHRILWWSAATLLLLAFSGFFFLAVRLIYRSIAMYAENDLPRHERSVPHTDLNPFGANFFLAREVEPWKIDKTLHMASDAGIGWVKQHFTWEQIEPSRKGEFLDPRTKEDSWTKYDRIVEACEKYNLEIVARLDRPPDWTREDNTLRQRPPDDFHDYGDFVYAFVSRYKGRIRYIQVWNEPNIYPEWGNRPVDPAGYVELLRIAYQRAKEADPNIILLSAPLAFTLGEPHPEPGRWRSMNDLDYLEAMYEAGFADYFDIYSVNAFGFDLPPDSPPEEGVLNFQRILLHREIMEKHGDGHKSVWFNEYGWNAAPEALDPEGLIWGRVTEREQAEYTLEGIRLAREEWPWAGVFFIWYFRQVGNLLPDHAEYYFRMVDVDFTPRRVYLAVQDVAKKGAVAGPGVYQQTSPPVQHYGRWQQVLVPGGSGGTLIQSDNPGDSVTFTFRGQHVDLIARRGPEYGRLLVSLDGRAVSGLDVDSHGASYVSLYSPDSEKKARITLVRNAGPGERTLRLIVSDDADPMSDGTLIAINAMAVSTSDNLGIPIVESAGLLTGLVAVGLLLKRTWRRIRFPIRS